ncbi:Dynein regulatory complex subunit 7 [Orchesella cincta]|uniref:Dynein regulatory complex subunit 7 n=1 Tax=Orchesella cincta TaxID=48709 RepID=A0A1D2N6F7_ORCCI|nr:Dynein regulatory complex subunit 7 [Orchesella cincta]
MASPAAQSPRQLLLDDEGFDEDLANFLNDNYTEDEEEDVEDTFIEIVPPEGGESAFWKNPDMPEKYPLDHVNVQNLVNMLSKIHLVWPEDLPYYDETEYSTEPDRAKFPATFYHNSDKEKAVLWHAENYRRQFIHLFPNRRPPVIAPRNECGCQKLFPTYITPTALGYPEFLDCVTTMEFLKDFFMPELMRPPTKMPERIRSHVTVLRKRNANCYEMSVIAASVLIGAGYDAYVVDGFASKTICTIDTTEDYHEPPETPILPYEIDDTEEEKRSIGPPSIHMDYFLGDRDEEAPLPIVSPSKYRFKKSKIGGEEEPVPVADPAAVIAGNLSHENSQTAIATGQEGMDITMTDSQGEINEEEEEDENEEVSEEVQVHVVVEEAAEEEEEVEEEEEIDEELSGPKDRYHGKRTHAWILILPGKRDVEAPFFLEPFSGTYRQIRDPNFFGIEAVFNHQNYYINIQPPVRNLRRLKYDLEDSSTWSKLLIEPPKKKKKSVTDDSMFQDDDDDELKPVEMYLTMPASWTTELDISQEDYDMKYPGGKKTIEYNDAIVELAAPYVNDDGLVRKVLKFNGPSRDPEDLEYIEEIFEHRKDKLYRRKWFREGKMLHEYFQKGRRDALKEHVHVSGRNKPDYPRDLYYYSNAHPRNVAHRQIIKKGMIEHFEGRDDLLYYKLTTFGGVLCNTIPSKDDEQRSKARHIIELVKGAGAGTGGGKKRKRRKITKIIEKYHRNDSKAYNEDLAEKHMLIEEGRLRILFHYCKGNLTRNTLEFFKVRGASKYAPVEFKPEDCIEYQANREAEPMNVYKKFLLLQQMEKEERSSSVLSREAEDEVHQTVNSRVQEDWRHEIEPDAFAGDRNEEYLKMMTQQVAEEDEEEMDLSGTDFTTPFFEKYGIPRSKKEEIMMKKRIMLHEKVKILRRAYMIKELYDKESTQLREKQVWYQRHIEQMNPTQEEDFNHMYKAKLFEMHILEQRMVRHQQETPRQYYNLLVQLLRHPQLNRFTNKKVPPPPPPVRELTEEEKARIARELAKLKDCCQFYNIKFSERKSKSKQRSAEEGEVNEGAEEQQSAPPTDGEQEPPPEVQGETVVATL